ncbi:PPE domain-containing protein [Mycobacterium paraterrae]|uniref:PPE domain-containing protein n=1 Tax=Mycobacterium paraterrae TaxID=577492 RepID=A0ABY3VP74_9MYCO|nr:PPE domain-containing protein [Mycobacterium paraterrae]UMB71237.1 PPE domain-containing protein [Mycobacterium paraterrae]
MPIDFGIYPPEINSLRMYTGPGPGPMLAASQAWDTLADELYTAAVGYRSVVSELTQTAWSGPSSDAMSINAERHVRWLTATAGQAEHSAFQARSAAAAYEAAFAATVPPPVVAANRSLLAALVATNVLGQNTPAIAATEALYAEMWAQDAVAMYNYAGSSAAAAVLTPFSTPEDVAPRVISVVPQALSALAAPAQGEQLSVLASLIAIFVNSPGDLAALLVLAPVDVLTGFAEVPPSVFTTLSGIPDDETFSHYNGEKAWPQSGPASVEPFPATLPNPPAGMLSAPTATAGLGEASMVGKLSVPSSWSVAEPEVRAVALTTPLTAAPMAAAAEVEAAMVGQAMAGPPLAKVDEDARPVAHGPAPAAKPPRPVVTGVVAAIRAIARQHAEGMLSEEEYNQRKKDLLEGALVRVERATGIEPA